MKFKDLYTEYLEFCRSQSKKHLNKLAFKDEIINIGINYIPYSKKYKHQGQNWVEITHEELTKIFLKNNLMTKEELGNMDCNPSNENGNNNNRNNIDDYLFQEKNETQKENEKQEKVKEQEQQKMGCRQTVNNKPENKEEDDSDDKEEEDESDNKEDEEESMIEIPAANKIKKILTTDEAINEIKLKNREFKIKINTYE
jgi:hypothetical protein